MSLRSLPVLLLVLALPATAQDDPVPARADAAPIVLTLDEAIQIALERSFAVRNAALDVTGADLQVREAWGQVLPSVTASGGYTRNVLTANPFAGSDAGGLFGSLAALDWLAFNERARTDGDPTTEPIAFEEFRRRQTEARAGAGLPVDPGDNPFAVPNQFQAQLALSQTIYNRTAFAAIRGARGLRAINAAALTQQQQQTVHRVRQQFYAALLAQEQAAVARASVERARATQAETARLVAAGTLPVLERLSAEVEATNLETQRLEAENQAALAATNLLFTLGLPVDRPVVLRGSLDLPEATLVETVALEDAVALALERRPELEQARLAVELQEVNREITRGARFPVLSAFANVGYLGNVPDDRRVARQGLDPEDPFGVDVERRGFFDGSYWNPTVAVGASLSWTLFDGNQTRYRVQQNTLEIERARLQLEQVTQQVALEVEQALRTIASARARLLAQRENVRTAETAFEFAAARLASGVATQTDVRLASAQLDQARLGYLQAAYDLLLARSELERATGVLLVDDLEGLPPRPPVLTTLN